MKPYSTVCHPFCNMTQLSGMIRASFSILELSMLSDCFPSPDHCTQEQGVGTKRKPEPKNEEKKDDIFSCNKNATETLFIMSLRSKTEKISFQFAV